ncbi:MAG TPA: hypothetical protein VLJ68_10655 [Chitinophagaceae bacterium]|nr:hypothetical protein [Chitinophagaceae bacterium]
MKTLFLFISLAVSSCLAAQKSQWLVFLVHGDVQLTAKGKMPVAVKTKQVLSSEDKIEIKNDQSEITFFNKAGDYYQVKEKGGFIVSDWVKKNSGKAPGITPKFMSYLYEEMLHPAKGAKRNSSESVAASWGAGSRGNACMPVKWPLNLIITSKDTLVFTWAHVSKSLHYQFIIYGPDGDEFFNCLIRDTQMVVNTATLRNADLNKFSWSVNPVLKPCEAIEKNRVELVNADEEEKRAAKISKEVPKTENEVLYNLAIADALGLAGFYDKAFEYYLRAIFYTSK